MKEEHIAVILEMREMLKAIADKQELLMAEIQAIREEQKKLHEEIRISNFVLNNISIRSEIIN